MMGVRMGRIELGVVLAIVEGPGSGEAPSWQTLRAATLLAEEVGFDTLWVPDELLWEIDDWDGPRGWWECVAMLGAAAEATSRIQVGSWVLSALHRNPGLTVRAVETLDEISGGRFVFGLGSGHAGRQGDAFGFPSDKTVGRYVEALEIILPLLRGGSVDFHGDFHTATELVSRPRGPRPGRIPLMLGGHGPRTMRLAVRHADIWSGFATRGQEPELFVEMLARLDEICVDESRDPASLGRSIGIDVIAPGVTDAGGWEMGPALKGSADDYVRIVEGFADIGCTRLELVVMGDPIEGIERFAPVVARAAQV